MASDRERSPISPEKVVFLKSGILRRMSKKKKTSHQMSLPEAIKTIVNLTTPTVSEQGGHRFKEILRKYRVPWRQDIGKH